jgi:hypothetical protein
MAAKLKIEKRGDEIKKKSSPLRREPSNDYFIKILFLLSKWFQTKRFLWELPIGSYVNLSLAVAAILHHRPVSKMATITKYRNFFKWPKLLYFKPEIVQI